MPIRHEASPFTRAAGAAGAGGGGLVHLLGLRDLPHADPHAHCASREWGESKGSAKGPDRGWLVEPGSWVLSFASCCFRKKDHNLSLQGIDVFRRFGIQGPPPQKTHKKER